MRKNNPYRKQIRRNNAKQLREKRDGITDQQQLERLDTMFGKGLGAAKERAKLAKRIDDARKQTEIKVEKQAKMIKAAKEVKRTKDETEK